MSSRTPRPITARASLSIASFSAPAGGDRRRGHAVVALLVVEDMGKPVPLRRALERHEDEVVGEAAAIRDCWVWPVIDMRCTGLMRTASPICGPLDDSV
jgi:hypothetical protein